MNKVLQRFVGPSRAGSGRRVMILLAVGVALAALVVAAAPTHLVLANSLVVNSKGDEDDANPADGICQTALNTCTLRAAIEQANATPGPDVITFNLGKKAATITSFNSLLPDLTDDFTTIDGGHKVTLDGNPTKLAYGLRVRGSSNKIQGLTLKNFVTAIQIDGTNNNSAHSNVVGTDGNSINDAQEGDVIVDNGVGVLITGVGASATSYGGTDGNSVAGNMIGVDATGMIAMPNGVGVRISAAAHDNTIGQHNELFNDVERNVISGNTTEGIEINNSSATHVSDNFIGPNAKGTASLSDGNYGLLLSNGATTNQIGPADGTAPGANGMYPGNVISAANSVAGIFAYGAPNNAIYGNLIGTDPTGMKPLGNGVGIELANGSDLNTVGLEGGSVARRNVISGNLQSGIQIFNSSSVWITSNYIGTDATGSFGAGLGNGQAGITIIGGGRNTIGNSTTNPNGGYNVISGNKGDGILIEGSSDTVYGNLIGTAAVSTTALGNKGNGIYILGSSNYPASNNVIGIRTNTFDFQNTIANNTLDGILVRSNDTPSSAVNNRFEANAITANGQLGIELATHPNATGFQTPNDAGDGDTGPNDLLNFPQMATAAWGSSGTTVTGLIANGLPNTQFKIGLYVSPSCDPSGYGEGAGFMGLLATVTTDGSGTAPFSMNVPVGAVPSNSIFTTTASFENSSASETSEFSNCAQNIVAQQNICMVQGLLPTGVITTDRPTFSWHVGPVAPTYHLVVSGFDGQNFDHTYQGADICHDGVCSVTPDVSLREGEHRWRVTPSGGASVCPASDAVDFLVHLTHDGKGGGGKATPPPFVP